MKIECRSVLSLGSALLLSLVLSACGGGENSSGTTTSNVPFPEGLALASPVSMTTGAITLADAHPSFWQRLSNAVYAMWQGDFKPVSLALGRLVPIADAWASSGHSPAYLKAANRINSLLTGAVTPRAGVAFDANKFLAYSDDATCYGPRVKYQNHPDGADGTPPELPDGDVGIWTRLDDNALTGTGHACAAAELDARMSDVTERTNTALMTLASMINVASGAGKSLPSAGSSLDLTADMNTALSGGPASLSFATATIEQSATGGVWTYTVRFSFVDGTSLSHNAEIKMTHTPGASSKQYDGLLTYAVTRGTVLPRNCPSFNVDVGTLKYSRTSLTAATLVQREGNYCGAGTATDLANSVAKFSSDGQLDPADKWDLVKGWANDFNRFGAEYDPTTSKGKYIFGWQAGYGDGNSRLFNIGLNYNSTTEQRDGEAYYGYGLDIPSSDGQIQGFICNWAGPNGDHTLKDYFQRQFISYNDTTGLWESAASASNITYAPVNSCAYAGGTSFIYDKNGNYDLSDDTAGAATVLDLADKTFGTTTYASVPLAIQGRGMTLPSVGF